MSDSILTSTKKVLGVGPDDTSFDVDILMHINSVLAILNQLGVGPDNGFMIEDADAVWSDFYGNDSNYNAIKTYVYIRVRLLFDPPTTSFLIAAHEAQYKELEWRINIKREVDLSPVPIEPDPWDPTKIRQRVPLYDPYGDDTDYILDGGDAG